MSIASLTSSYDSCYLWTFTVADIISPQECACRWNTVQRKLVRKGFYGVRVFELHPGGHGLHVHAVCVQRYDVDLIRSITSAYGFGRINVKRIPSLKSVYVAKYLSKQFVEEHPELKGLRLWACVGTKLTDWKGTRVVNVESFSETHKIFSELWESASPYGQRSFALASVLWKVARLVSAKIAVVSHRTVGGEEHFSVTIPHPVTGYPVYSLSGIPSHFT